MRKKTVFSVGLWVDDSDVDLRLIYCRSEDGRDADEASPVFTWLRRTLCLEKDSAGVWVLEQKIRKQMRHEDAEALSVVISGRLGAAKECRGILVFEIPFWERVDARKLDGIPASIQCGKDAAAVTVREIMANPEGDWWSGVVRFARGSIVFCRLSGDILIDVSLVDDFGNFGQASRALPGKAATGAVARAVEQVFETADENRRRYGAVRRYRLSSACGQVLYHHQDRRVWSSEPKLPAWLDENGAPTDPVGTGAMGPQTLMELSGIIASGILDFRFAEWTGKLL